MTTANELLNSLASGTIHYLRRQKGCGNVSEFYPHCRHLWDEYCCFVETGHSITILDDFHEIGHYLNGRISKLTEGQKAILAEYLTVDEMHIEGLITTIYDDVIGLIRKEASLVDIHKFEMK